jgi:pilus assembly protein CpaE
MDRLVQARSLRSNDVVITATPDLASLRNARNIVELLKQSRSNDAAAILVLNSLC